MAIRKVQGYSLMLLEICIILLNSVAIIVILRFKKKFNPDILIFSLAVADLLKAFIPLNMTLVAYLLDKPMEQVSYSCKMFGWTAFTLNSGIMLVMTIMAVDRYLAMCWPFRYKELFPKKRLIYTIILAFVFSGTYSALPLIGVGKIQSYYNGSFCHFDFDSTKAVNRGYSTFVLSLGISMLVVVIFCYTRAMFSVQGLIKRQRRMSTPSRDTDGSEQKRQSMNRMFARLMIVMMMAFCISWLLFLVVILQHMTGWYTIAPEAHFWSMRLAVVNSVLNPLIGAAMCKRYRKGYLFIFCKILHCCGLCSFYNIADPWYNSRKSSVGSRNSNERDPPHSPTRNLNDSCGRLRNQPSFCHNDSGIVPDSSIGYHQGGVIIAAERVGRIHSINEDQGPKQRPRLERKRISFKDEMGGVLTLQGKQPQTADAIPCSCDNEQFIQITHFPVGATSRGKTRTVPNIDASSGQSTYALSLSSTSGSFVPERADVTSVAQAKPLSESFGKDSQIAEKTVMIDTPENKEQEAQVYSSPPVTAKRTKSSFNRTKSLDSSLRKKSVRSTHRAICSVFERLSSERLEGAGGIPRSAESNQSHSPPEIQLNFAHGKPDMGASLSLASEDKLHSLTSKLFKDLNESSPKDLEREVFC